MKSAGKKRLFTGLQPSGQLHIGNYFGALQPFVEMYPEYESFVSVVDYHALTTVRDSEMLRRYTIDIVKDYLAAGIDPENAVIFKQSDVPEHTELAWIFECLVTVPFLMQSHAYKDKVAKGIEPSAGLFNYPMLMAADILLYDTDIVPVGEDQRQHIEYAREAAQKFNNAYAPLFTQPKEHILTTTGVIPGTDGQKMSKSYKNTIPLFGSKDEVASAVMGIVTDSEGEYPEYVHAIHTHFTDPDTLNTLYKEQKGQYKALKEALIEDIEVVIAPLREKRNAITDANVEKVLTNGKEKARAYATEKMDTVKSTIGIL